VGKFLPYARFRPKCPCFSEEQTKPSRTTFEALALVVLEKGGLQVELSYRAELMTTLSTLGNWHLCREQAGQDVLGAESSSLSYWNN